MHVSQTCFLIPTRSAVSAWTEADDRAIWRIANGLTIVTLDSDFADLAALFGPPPKVIWLRCGNQTTEFI